MRDLLVAVLITAFVVSASTGHPHKRNFWRRRQAFNLESTSCGKIKRADLCNCCKDPCDDVECLNNGVCVNGICNCPRGFSGADCGVDLCAAKLCQNNGTCVPTADGVSCKCEDGYTGDNCEEDECEPNPCQNCGTCSRIEGGFKCSCLGRISGPTCEVIDNIITSPNYPNDYSKNDSFDTIIPGCDGKQIHVVFDEDFVIRKLDLPICNPDSSTGSSLSCGDYLLITISSIELLYCGGTPPPPFTIKSDVKIELQAVSSIGCMGFKLNYTYIDV